MAICWKCNGRGCPACPSTYAAAAAVDRAETRRANRRLVGRQASAGLFSAGQWHGGTVTSVRQTNGVQHLTIRHADGTVKEYVGPDVMVDDGNGV
jgi:hypothetical protein